MWVVAVSDTIYVSNNNGESFEVIFQQDNVDFMGYTNNCFICNGVIYFPCKIDGVYSVISMFTDKVTTIAKAKVRVFKESL